MSTFDVGSIFGTQNYSGIVDSASPFHLYNFNVNSSGSFQVSLGGLSNNADVQLLGNSGNILYSSTNSGTTPEQISVDILAAGAYAIRVAQLDGATNYNLSLSWAEKQQKGETNSEIDPITGLGITSGNLQVETPENIAVTTTGLKIESDSLTGGTTEEFIADSQPTENLTNPSTSASQTPTAISPESQDTEPETIATNSLESSGSSTDKQAIRADAQASANASPNPTATDNPTEVSDAIASPNPTATDNPTEITDAIASPNTIATDNSIEADADADSTNETTTIPSDNNSTIDLNLPQNPSFNFGKFVVDATGIVGIDYLFDGGWFEGQLGIFSLTGMEQLIPHSDEFILEAARRAASNSQLGYVVINDLTEGARFSGGFPFDNNLNKGSYLGVKTFNMRPGDSFAIILIPNRATMQQVADQSVTGDDVRPLFSLPIANPDGSFAVGQIADVTGEGNTFVMEDIGQNKSYSDKDFNDIIFQVRGAIGSAASIDSVINPQKEWRTSNMGQALIEYAKAYITPADPIVETPIEPVDPTPPVDINPPVDSTPPIETDLPVETKPPDDPEKNRSSSAIANTLPDTVQFAINRAENLEAYDPVALAATRKWVVGISTDQDATQLPTLFNAQNLGSTEHIPNTYIWEFPDTLTPAQVQQQLKLLPAIEFSYPLVPYQQEKRLVPNDTLFANQWHLQNTSQTGGTAGADANITSAWDTVKGTGVAIAIVDDGLQHTHPDLQPNYRPDLSRDFNETVGSFNAYDNDPSPNAWESHGTSAGGVAAARGNNSTGVSGAAPNAFLAGLRLTAGASTDLTEADALSYLKDDIDIYNNSWGPSDDGQTLQAPNPLTAGVLHAGATQGRNGLGNIYVWSGGNGQQNKDNVNYDGYANSRYTIAVAAIDHNGKQSSYSEPGAPLLVSGYSSGTSSGITTTDLVGADGESSGDYTSSFGGTSAAAPLVSGVVALMLEANPTLTWRDVQHVLVETAKKNDPTDSDWKVNGAGRNINHKYGFGAIDAAAAVSAATTWKPVGTEFSVSSGLININAAIPDNNGTLRSSTFNINQEITVEKVEVMFDAQHPNRGDLDVRLVSPDGTESILAERHNDTGDNYNQWVFTSARNWGESSKGDWKLRVADRRTGNTGTWNSWKLNLYGSKPTVSISATNPNATEGGDAGEFTITRTGSTKNPLTVNYEFGGEIHWSEPPGTNGTDYEYLPGSITIPAGASSVKIPIIPQEDTQTEWTETVKLNLMQNNAYEVSAANTDTVKIWDNEKSRVMLYAEWSAGIPSNFHSSNYASESGNKGMFLFRRHGNIKDALTVNYTMTGTATSGVDYQALPGSITFAPGEWGVAPQESFIPIDDNEIEGEETAILTINPSAEYNILDDWGSRTTTIWDNDNKPTVTITATDPTASEYGDKGQFTITRTGDTSNPLTVNYWEREWWLKAIPGQDYQQPLGSIITNNMLDGSVTIPAGASSVTIDINPIDDNLVEGDNERVSLFLKTSSEYVLGGDERADVWFQDNDSPKVDWKRQIGTSAYDYSNSVAVDNAGNLYIAGRTSGNLAGTNSGSYDAWVSKYNSSGIQLWKQQIGTSGYDAANGVAVDNAGNTYITGWTDGSFNNNNVNRDAWLAKYNSSGNQVWKKQLGVLATTTSAGYDIANGAVTVSSDGSIYITGRTLGNLGGTNQGEADAWVAKYDSNGNQNWVKQLGTSAWDEANGAAVDSAGNVYITGHTKGALGGTFSGDVDAWAAKYDSNGNLLWKQQLGTMAEDSASSVAVDSNGNLYVTGHTKSKLGDAFAGNPYELGENNVVWAAIHGDTSGLGGTYYGNADAWVAQFNSSNGNLNWKRQLGTANYDSASGVATDSFGNVYITGRTRGKLGENQAGGDDAWVVKYNINGALQWRQQLGTTGEDVSNGIAVSSTGIYITGATSGSLDGINQGGDDAWVIKFS